MPDCDCKLKQRTLISPEWRYGYRFDNLLKHGFSFNGTMENFPYAVNSRNVSGFLLISSNTCCVVVSRYPCFMQVSSALANLISRKMQMMDEVSNIFILSSCPIKEFLNREPG